MYLYIVLHYSTFVAIPLKEHMVIDTFWFSDHPEYNEIIATVESACFLIIVQKNLRTFKLRHCRGHIDGILSALKRQAKYLRHISFHDVDFNYCSPWTDLVE